jgi:hypothetical protein
MTDVATPTNVPLIGADLIMRISATNGYPQRTSVFDLQAFFLQQITEGSLPSAGTLTGEETIPISVGAELYQISVGALLNSIASLAGDVTEENLTTALASYVVQSALNQAIAGCVSETALAAALANYVQTSALPESLAGYLPLAGGTMEGPINGLVVNAGLVVAGNAGSSRFYYNSTNTKGYRWAWGANGTAESGSNVGSDWDLWSYSDTGALLQNPVHIARSTGIMTLAERPVFGTNTPYDTGNLTISNYLTVAAATGEYAPLSGTPTIYAVYTFQNSPQVPTSTAGNSSANAASTQFAMTAVNNGVGAPFDVVHGYSGPMPPVALTANQVLFSYMSFRDVYMVPVYSLIQPIVNPTNTVTLSVTLAGTSIGNVTIAPNGTVTWNLADNYNNDLPIARSQLLVIQAPSSPDPTLAGISITMSGYATATFDH